MTKINLKETFQGSCPWTLKGPNLLDSESLEAIRHTLDKHGSVILEHWHFYGSRAPDRLIIDDYEEFVEYLNTNAIAGDLIDVWAMHSVCKKENILVSGKCPNKDGLTPEGGAY